MKEMEIKKEKCCKPKFQSLPTLLAGGKTKWRRIILLVKTTERIHSVPRQSLLLTKFFRKRFNGVTCPLNLINLSYL